MQQVIEGFVPDRSITFVSVEKFEGDGSGLGHSLLCGRKELDCPFIFVSNDTLTASSEELLDPTVVGNWAGYYSKQPSDGYQIENYRTLNISNGRVTDINPKGTVCKEIYIGLAGVKDYKEFWELMEHSPAISVGEAYALNGLANIKAVEFKSWYDCGSLHQLERAKAQYVDNDHNILEKENEAIWFHENRVIKFSVDEKFISERVERTKNLPKSVLPKITKVKKNIYCYEKVEGSVFSKNVTATSIKSLLDFAEDKLWSKTDPPSEEAIRKACFEFYREKTFERVNAYLQKFERVDSIQEVNGSIVPAAMDLLHQTPWGDLCDSPHVSLFHGDFHNENILIAENGDFVFLDWRQNFGVGNYNYGDAYYDLAKFLHGLIVSHSVVAEGQFFVDKRSDKSIHLDILRPNSLVEGEEVFRRWLTKNGYNVQKVEVLCALVFLNIAVLHEAPYSEFLFLLGKYRLSQTI